MHNEDTAGPKSGSIIKELDCVANATEDAKLVQNSTAQDDLRVRRTRKMLLEALIDLSVEKGFPNVTVSDICEKAMVNRSTFYRHYLDKYALLDEYMEEVTKLTFDDGMHAVNPKQIQEVPQGLYNLLMQVQSFSAFYRVMLGQNGDAAFTDWFRQNIQKRFRYLVAVYGVDEEKGSSPLEMRLNYVACAGIGAIMWWLENGQPCSVEQLAIWIGKLSIKNVGLKLPE
jgi:AcrR family transcriptional regulator